MIKAGFSRWVAVVALSLPLLLTASGLSARALPEGPLPQPGTSDGLLAVVVDTDTFIHSLRLRREEGRGRGEIKKIRPGRTLHVLRLPAGNYVLHRVDSAPTSRIGLSLDFVLGGKHRFNLGRGDRVPRISLRAGELNYGGDLYLRFRNGILSMATPNRGEQALALLRKRHGHDPARLPMHWTGDSPDPYPAWRPATAAVLGDDAFQACPEYDSLPSGAPGAFDLFRSGEIGQLRLNPSGDLLLEVAYREGWHEVNVIDPAGGGRISLFRGKAVVAEAVWLGPRRVAAHLFAPSGANGVHVYTFGGGLNQQDVRHLVVPVEGYILDPLSSDPNAMLFAMSRPGHSDPLQVFRLDVSKSELAPSQLAARRRLNPGSKNDIAWLGDGSGQLRVALLRGEEGTTLAIRTDAESELVPIARLDVDSLVELQAIDDDGSVLLLTNQGREQVDLVRMDPSRPGVVETVASVPGVDLAAVARSSGSGRVIGVRYYLDGLPKTQFFDLNVQRWQQRVETAFPQRNAHLVDIDQERGRAVVMVADEVTPPAYYWFDAGSDRVDKIADDAPWLRGQRFVRRHVSTVAAADGHSIQVLTAIPGGDGPHPVLVMPHGGPFYVQDVLNFDSDVQYWATRGFAVMQINFRGSYGFGVRHLVAGFAGFGRQIEDDIEAALAAVLDERQELDRTRICAIGASYGGYSALMLALRDPERIRCAVAISAPTDLPLLFTSSDWNRRSGSLEAMQRLVGDPADPALQQLSPLYRAGDLVAPVLLVHGGRDRRVDYEHSVRMATALAYLGKPHQLIRLDEMGHAPETVGQHVCVNGVAEQFIREQMAGDR